VKVGDLVILLRPVVGAYDGFFGIITSARLTLASPNQQPCIYTVHWNDKMGNGSYWSYELEVISESNRKVE
jgi:hypothetical protein